MNGPSYATKALQLRPFGSQWEAIKPYFPTARRRRHDLRREVLDAILYVVKTGCQWRMLPGEFAPWQTVYYYFDQWREEGRLQCLLSALRRTVRREAGREGEPSALILDCDRRLPIGSDFPVGRNRQLSALMPTSASGAENGT